MPELGASRSRGAVPGLRTGVPMVAVLALLWWAGWLSGLELGVFDRVRRLRPASPTDPRIALVRIGEEEVRRLGHPLADRVLAELLERILAAGPRAVGVDLYRDGPVGPGAQRLRRVLEADPRVVMIEKLGTGPGGGVAALPYLDPASRVGFSDLLLDSDGVVRRALLYAEAGDGTPRAALSLLLAARHLAAEGRSLRADPRDPRAVRLGSRRLPRLESPAGPYPRFDDRGYQIALDYARGGEPFDSLPASAVLAGAAETELLEGRTVLVGTMAESVKDRVRTPFGDAGSRHGIEVHAHLVSQLLRIGLDGEAPFVLPGPAATLGAMLLAAAAGLLLAPRLPPWLGVLAVPLAGAGLFGAAVWADERRFFLPVVPPTLALAASWGGAALEALAAARSDRALFRRLFVTHQGRRLAEHLFARRRELLEGGRLRPELADITVLMADVEGFTAATEALGPRGVLDWVGAVLEVLAARVEEHGGIVDDFVGDAIKADFGALPASRGEAERAAAARRALDCALAIAPALEELERSGRVRGPFPVRMRVGIASGPAVLGEVGSRERLKFTSLGDTVNAAARLETLDKESFGAESAHSRVRILVDGETRRRAGAGWSFGFLGEVVPRGQSRPVPVYRLLGRDEGRARDGGSGPAPGAGGLAAPRSR